MNRFTRQFWYWWYRRVARKNICACGHFKEDHYRYILNNRETPTCRGCDPAAGLPGGNYLVDKSYFKQRDAADHPFTEMPR